MFACLYGLPSSAEPLIALARDFSPRLEVVTDRIVTIDLDGLDRLFGTPIAIANALRRTAADRGCFVHVAVAETRTAAMLLAQAHAGVTVVPPGGEAAVLAPLPLRTLELFSDSLVASSRAGQGRRPANTTSPSAASATRPSVGDSTRPSVSDSTRSSVANTTIPSVVSGFSRTRSATNLLTAQSLSILKRWGVKTLGELAALPSAELSERLGQTGIAWQRVARGQDVRPLVPHDEELRFEQSLELEWPIDGLEPLSFVLSRLLDPLSAALERADRAAAVLHVRLRLVTRGLHERSLQLPAPIRDPRVLRTLIILDLESHPPPAGIDVVTVAIEPTASRVVQGSLLSRAVPAAEQLSTLMARVGALMGEDRCGSATLVDSYRPGAFRMAPFCVNDSRPPIPDPCPPILAPRPPTPDSRSPTSDPRPPILAIRRFRTPVPARVTMHEGRPVSVWTDRRGIAGGRVARCTGPWRTSGEWWRPPSRDGSSHALARQASSSLHATSRASAGWNRDEWDVVLDDGSVLRIFEDRESGRWSVDGVID